MNKSSIVNLYNQLTAVPGVEKACLVITGRSALVMHGLLDSCERLDLFGWSVALSALMTHAGVKKDITIFGIEYSHEMMGLPIRLRREPDEREKDFYITELLDNCWVVSKFSMLFVCVNTMGRYCLAEHKYADDAAKVERVRARRDEEKGIVEALLLSSRDFNKDLSV